MINTELSGTPNEPQICEEMFYHSMETLLPVIEREGTRVEIQSYPWDFCEENGETVGLAKLFRSDNIKYLYNVPHSFYYDKRIGETHSVCW